jgi:hypothetical protein
MHTTQLEPDGLLPIDQPRAVNAMSAWRSLDRRLRAEVLAQLRKEIDDLGDQKREALRRAARGEHGIYEASTVARLIDARRLVVELLVAIAPEAK